jgi:hypothetical protein
MRTMIILILATCSVTAIAGYDYVIDKYSESMTIKGHESLLMIGGGMYQLDAKDFSTIDLQNTAPFEVDKGGIGILALSDWSRLNMVAGEIYVLGMGNESTAVLSGGRIDNIESWQTVLGSNQHIEMIVKDYSYNTLTKILKGTWGDDSLFKIQLIDRTQYDYSPAIENIKFTIIPEPLTLGLLAIGGLLIRRRK